MNARNPDKITGIELVLAMLVSILVTAGVAFGVFICWRFKMKRKNENPNKGKYKFNGLEFHDLFFQHDL